VKDNISLDLVHTVIIMHITQLFVMNVVNMMKGPLTFI